MEGKHGFKHVQDQTRLVSLSELHDSCSSLDERSKISTTTQKRENSILSVFLNIHKRAKCTNPGRWVTIFHTASA